MIHVTMPRAQATYMGREGLKLYMQERFPEARIQQIAFDPSWDMESPAWVYGEREDVRIGWVESVKSQKRRFDAEAN